MQLENFLVFCFVLVFIQFFPPTFESFNPAYYIYCQCQSCCWPRRAADMCFLRDTLRLQPLPFTSTTPHLRTQPIMFGRTHWSWRYCFWEQNQDRAIVKYLTTLCVRHVMKVNHWSSELTVSPTSTSTTICAWQCKNKDIVWTVYSVAVMFSTVCIRI